VAASEQTALERRVRDLERALAARDKTVQSATATVRTTVRKRTRRSRQTS
jgi:hypothetical protein